MNMIASQNIVNYLEWITTNYQSTISSKIRECDILGLRNIFKKSIALEKFGNVLFSSSEEHGIEPNIHEMFKFPTNLMSLSGLNYKQKTKLPSIFPWASSLQKLDLQYTLLSTTNYCQLLQSCNNIEFLEPPINNLQPKGSILCFLQNLCNIGEWFS
jgi:hypothetical protein